MPTLDLREQAPPVCVLLMGIAFLPVQMEGWSRARHLAAEGVVTTGTVMGSTLNRSEASVRVQYPVAGDVVLTGTVPAARNYVQSLGDGGYGQTVRLRYSPGDPEVAEIEGQSPFHWLGAAFVAAWIAAAAVWLLVVFRRRG